MTIQPLTIEAYGAAYALWQSLPGIGLRSLDDGHEGIARFLARNPGTCLAAYRGDQLIGTVLCGHDGKRGTLYHLCVAEDARGQGIGSALVNRALEALKQEGTLKANLVCFRTNEKGNAFWRAMGWTLREDLCYYDYSLSAENV